MVVRVGVTIGGVVKVGVTPGAGGNVAVGDTGLAIGGTGVALGVTGVTLEAGTTLKLTLSLAGVPLAVVPSAVTMSTPGLPAV